MADETKAGTHLTQVREAAGLLAVGLADELARPLAEVKALLASAVDKLDTHTATAKGPDPLSYDDSKLVRETIADAYLKTATISRLASDLAVALAGPGSVENGDLNALLDDAVSLVRHRFSASTELFIDLGTLPPLPLAKGELVLALARILMHCADSTQQAEEAAVSVRTSCSDGRSEIRLTIAENGHGADADELDRVSSLARSLAKRLGGSLDAVSAEGAGATFELRLPVGAR